MPADEPLHDAARRTDIGRLSRHLDPHACSPTVFRRLIQHEDAPVRHLGLLLLTERIASGPPAGDPEAAELAALLPRSVEGPPETALVLARLYEQLGPALPDRSWPSWRTAGLPVRVRIAWLRAELIDEPSVIHRESPGELLYQAVRETSAARAHRPARLVAELADSGDPVLRGEALRLARQGLRAGLLSPARVRDVVIGLLDGGSAVVVAAALEELSEPWAASEPLPPGCLAPFLAAESVTARPLAADAALKAAVHHGHGFLLRQVIADSALPPELRRRAMELLGDLADRGDIAELTAVAVRDPLLFGGPAVTCLRGLHRRGHFTDGPHAVSVVGLALADHSVAADDVATILFTCRDVVFRVLVDAEADDPSWPRRLALLVALAGQGTDLPIGEAITRVLPLAPAPKPFLDAIRDIRHEAAEDAVLARLPSAPAAALDALEAVGGQRTVLVLKEGLGLGADGHEADGRQIGIAPHLRAERHRALEILWHLTGDPAERQALLVRLDPTDLPPRVATDLGGPDERELALLRSRPDPGDPASALCGLAVHGDARTLPAIADLLARIVTELAASWEPGPPARTPGNGRPAGEPSVPHDVSAALHALGRRLHARGKIRPSCLLDAVDAEAAGHALVATTALDLLDRPGLTGGEQAILLELLLRAPYGRTRARVHRMLRHRDRHVRKHVIALLARDARGDDARALSATLIALTAAQDVQTVRQALIALGHAGAHWACPAITACLAHPNMNIKKTAAGVLIRSGTPVAVPALLLQLGHHGNPGLRATLVEALRAILGEAYPATLLAAAEHSDGPGTRELLLEGLDGALSARSVLALDDQASPTGPALLGLVAAGRVALASGTVDDLAARMAERGITPATGYGPADAERRARADAGSLVTHGWNPSVALRVVARDELPDPGPRHMLRPMLADWLGLADSEPAVRDRVVRFTLRLCPAPWTAGEPTVFARFAQTLADALATAPGEDRSALVAVLEEAAPVMTAVRRPAVADAVRALRPAPGGHRSTLTLLRRLGAVLVRADLDQALAAARLGAAPRSAEAAVLREAFGVPDTRSVSAGAGSRQAAPAEAVRAPDTLEDLRRTDSGGPGSRARLAALIEAYSTAGPEARTALIDSMAALQPLDAPPWTIAETAHATAPAARSINADDLDQPRSTALRERLLTMLGGPDPVRGQTAALELLKWPEPEAGLPVLRAFLHGRVDLPSGTRPARALAVIDETELRADGILHDRVALTASELDPWDLERLIPLLLEWWDHGPHPVGPAVERALNRVPADVLAEHLGDRLDSRAWGYLDLLAGRPLLRTPALDRTCRRLREEGRDDLADELRLVEGPLRGPDAARRDSAEGHALRDLSRTVPTAAAPRPSRQELLDLARTGTPERIRRALTRLAEEHPGPGPDPDPGLPDLLGELLRHPKAGVRLHAHRTSRVMLDRRTYLSHTSVLLDDARPDVVRMAVRTLCRAAWVPAVPAVTGLLEHAHPVVRRAAAEGLVAMGAPAVPALRRAAGHARPDKRYRYTDVLEEIAAALT